MSDRGALIVSVVVSIRQFIRMDLVVLSHVWSHLGWDWNVLNIGLWILGYDVSKQFHIFTFERSLLLVKGKRSKATRNDCAMVISTVFVLRAVPVNEFSFLVSWHTACSLQILLFDLRSIFYIECIFLNRIHRQTFVVVSLKSAGQRPDWVWTYHYGEAWHRSCKNTVWSKQLSSLPGLV